MLTAYTEKTQWRDLGLRPLKSRSVIASALIGSEAAGLSSRRVVRFANLFAIPEGTVRVTLSRMVADGELELRDGRYAPAGAFLRRRNRQRSSRSPTTLEWDGRFWIEIVSSDRRSPARRSELRTALHNLLFAEYREGVWMRPNNLDPDRLPEAAAVVREQCQLFTSRLDGDAASLVRRLWDLKSWQDRANRLRAGMSDLMADIEAERPEVIAPGFILAAAVTHHLLADPLLPRELLPATWPGATLRKDWERFDTGWQRLLNNWLNSEE